MTVSIYCCIIKYWTKQKHLLQFYDVSDKEIDIKKYIIKTESAELNKKIDIKNLKCYYLDDKVKAKGFTTLIYENSYKNILAYNISYKTLFGSKPLRSGWIY